MSDAVERLEWLCSPDAERLGDGERINQFVKAGLEAIEELERLRSLGPIHSTNNAARLRARDELGASNCRHEYGSTL